MNALKQLGIAVALALTLAGIGRAADEPRQYYTERWQPHPSGGYYFLEYRFKPDPAQGGYRRQFCIFYPSRPGHFYFFNPNRGTYWGRYNLKTRHFELLETPVRKLAEISDSDFREAKEPPPIPEARDRVAMMEPPTTDLPGKSAIEAAREARDKDRDR
jgi:hypothetical protein